MARKNRTRYTVLGTLTLGARSGYDIKRFIERSIGHFWSESYGQIYPTLRILADEGLVTKAVEDQTNRPARHVFSITARGRKELEDWLGEPAEPDVPRIEVLLKLFFGTQAPPGANMRHVQRLREEAERVGTVCGETAKDLSARLKDHPNLPYWLLALRQGTLVHRALLRWCDEAERVIRDLEDDRV